MQVNFVREIRPQPIAEAVIVLTLHEARALYAYLDSDERAPNMPSLVRSIRMELRPTIEED